jgi:hypothetical protein
METVENIELGDRSIESPASASGTTLDDALPETELRYLYSSS